MKIVSYPLPLANEGSFEASEEGIKARDYPRAELTKILTEYNASIGNPVPSDLMQKNCVVTGQQLGFMGGPIYTILKGIHCVLLARKLNATPIFWLATEDHDVGEIDHTYLIDPHGNLKKYHLSLPKEGYFVEDLILKEKNLAEITQFFDALQIDSPIKIEAGISYAAAMEKLLVYLFKGTGLVFVEPKLLRPLARSFFQQEILGERNLFIKTEEGLRKKIDASWDEAELLKMAQDHPERLSCNFSSRPVMQSALIPTIAYIAGPNEMQYYRELGTMHACHDVPMPCLVPRMHATFIPKEAAKILEQCQLNPLEPVPEKWEHIFPNLSFQDLGKSEAKQLRKKILEEKGLVYDQLHYLHNLLHPKERLQERVLNWFQFQSQTSENLVQAFLKQVSIDQPQHHLCYL